MNIVKQTASVKCDMGNCKNKANFSVMPDDAGARQYINLCCDCMEKLHAEISKVISPRAIINIVARGEKFASQSIRENLKEISLNDKHNTTKKSGDKKPFSNNK